MDEQPTSKRTLTYELKSRDDVLIVHLRGWAQFDQSKVLDHCFKEVQARAERRIVIDLSDLQYVGSAALGAFVGLRQYVETQQGVLRLAAPNSFVTRVFEAAGFPQYFTIVASLEEALRE